MCWSGNGGEGVLVLDLLPLLLLAVGVHHSRPDIANVTRELSKVLDGPTQAAYKELKRAIKFVLDTEQYGLKIEPRIPENSGEPWDLIQESVYCKDTFTARLVFDSRVFKTNFKK
jgi:hypothetical protein